MKNNKLILLMLSLLLVIGLMAACSTVATDEAEAPATGEAPAEEAEEPKSPPVKVIMTYLHGGVPPADMQLVVDEINKITLEKINVEVEFYPLGFFEPFTGKYSVLISSGERIDLMMVAFQNLADYANAGLIEPLDDLLNQYAPTITALSQEFPITVPGTVDGQAYGVSPVAPTYGNQLGFIMKKAWVNEFSIPEKDIYTLDEVGEIFGKVKEAYPDTYPACILGTGSFPGLFPMDALGASAASGVLVDIDSTQIVNFYETEQYHDYILTLRQWYEAGYIPPDAATTTATLAELTSAGVCGAYPMIMEPVQTTTTGFETVRIPVTINYFTSLAPTGVANWTVPITAENPDAAIKFLDLMYSDHDVANLILWGIEGKHYVLTDEEQVIAFPEGIDAQTSGYYVTFGLYGDRRYEYQWDVRATKPYNDAYTAANMENPFMAVDYAFNAADYSNQIIAIQSVIDKYGPALQTGSADVESTYADFIAELKAADIDDVIAANQAQFDAWLAEK